MTDADLDIIILAQGSQKRMGPVPGYKQLLPLPACGHVPLMARTIKMLCQLDKGRGGCMRITVVSWPELLQDVRWYGSLSAGPCPIEFNGATIRWVTLFDPGNSSLKGIARYLEFDRPCRNTHADAAIVLLGDVVYSWRCLDAIMNRTDSYGFVGTSDLSSGGGELWGVAWNYRFDDILMADLRDAMLKHPPFDDEYQPGQMRRWITGWRRGDLAEHVASLRRRGFYIDVDDYTMDVDLPTHIAKLEPVSRLAARDDAAHGLLWTSEGSNR